MYWNSVQFIPQDHTAVEYISEFKYPETKL